MAALLLASINVARARPLALDDGGSLLCAMPKRPVEGPVEVGLHGLAGDDPADPTAAGGLGAAVSAYPHEHYRFWQTVRAQARVAGWNDPLAPGSLGENLTLAGLLETQAWVGDVLRFADCELAVSGPRLPPPGLNAALGFRHAAALMRANGWCGFQLAVRRPGVLRPGEAFEVVPGAREVGIAELFRARVPAERRE